MNNILLITGGSGTIGSATCRRFADNGYDLLNLDLNNSSLKVPTTMRTVVADVTRPDDIARAIERGLSELSGTLTSVISLAGGAHPEEAGGKNFDELSLDTWDRSLKLNLSSHFYLLKAVYPLLCAGAAANKAITLVSSINALGAFGLPPYSAAKAGLQGLMHALVDEFGARGVRINVVCPGTIPNPRTLKNQRPESFEHLKTTTATGRFCEADDIARLMYEVTTNPSITGQSFVIDNGQLAHRGSVYR